MSATAANRRPPMDHDRARENGRIAAGIVALWVLIAGVLAGIGKLIMITSNGNGNLLGDYVIPHWFAAHRTPVLNHWSQIASLVFAALWLTVITRLIQPSQDGLRRGGRLPLGLPRRKGAGHSREAEPANRWG